jgi:hypothetical protein
MLHLKSHASQPALLLTDGIALHLQELPQVLPFAQSPPEQASHDLLDHNPHPILLALRVK